MRRRGAAAQNDGTKFWLQVVTELRNRNVQDIFIARVDGFKGSPEATQQRQLLQQLHWCTAPRDRSGESASRRVALRCGLCFLLGRAGFAAHTAFPAGARNHQALREQG